MDFKGKQRHNLTLVFATILLMTVTSVDCEIQRVYMDMRLSQGSITSEVLKAGVRSASLCALLTDIEEGRHLFWHILYCTHFINKAFMSIMAQKKERERRERLFTAILRNGIRERVLLSIMK